MARQEAAREELQLHKYDQVMVLDWDRFEQLAKAAVGNAAGKCVLRKLAY